MKDDRSEVPEELARYTRELQTLSSVLREKAERLDKIARDLYTEVQDIIDNRRSEE